MNTTTTIPGIILRKRFVKLFQSPVVFQTHMRPSNYSTQTCSLEEMASNPVSMRFFEFLIAVSGIKRVLEIGAFIGVSTMNFARSVPDDGQVVSIEKLIILQRLLAKTLS